MREFDDNPHSYGPVLRRIAILAAVVVIVPAMLWVITSFMRTYVAQPVIASPKPLAPATTGSIDTGSTAAATRPATSVVEAGATATDSNPPAPAAKVASLPTPDTPASVPPSASPQPPRDAASAQPAWPSAPAPNTAPANAAANNGPWPDPSQAIGEQQLAPSAATAAADTNDNALPPTPPLTGPIPLPPHRPAVIAMAATGAVPLPRARPADATAPAADANPDGSGSNFLTHLFGQTH